jgi:hypothetical protein
MDLDTSLMAFRENPFYALISMGGLGVGFGLADLADGKGVPLASVAELAVPAVAFALNGSHWGCPPGQRHRDVAPTVAEDLQKDRLLRFCISS